MTKRTQRVIGSAILTVRSFGVMAAAWLMFSSMVGTGDLEILLVRTLPMAVPSELLGILLTVTHLVAPSVFLGLMLAMPWSRIRPRVLWSASFLLLLIAAGFYLWRLYLPYSTQWDSEALWQNGVIPFLLGIGGFVVLQVTVVALGRRIACTDNAA